MKNKLMIGSLEICDLPELGISDLEIRVDTGAKTSSLHVDNIEGFKQGGKFLVRFDLHPDIYHIETVKQCVAPVCDIRRVKSSNGEAEDRYVIKTNICFGDLCWPIEITLTDRSDMTYLMLLGREGMKDRVIIDPSKVFIAGDLPAS